ncbi:MAG TPA: hypothetical protein VF151_09750 [Gemmatimonadales bacterium]
MTQTSKTAATRIARHLVRPVRVVAAGMRSGKTYGFDVACGDGQYTTVNCGTYADARKTRAERIQEIVETLVDGETFDGRPAPSWMSLDFVW